MCPRPGVALAQDLAVVLYEVLPIIPPSSWNFPSPDHGLQPDLEFCVIEELLCGRRVPPDGFPYIDEFDNSARHASEGTA